MIAIAHGLGADVETIGSAQAQGFVARVRQPPLPVEEVCSLTESIS
jgi:hypothetical protein